MLKSSFTKSFIVLLVIYYPFYTGGFYVKIPDAFCCTLNCTNIFV